MKTFFVLLSNLIGSQHEYLHIFSWKKMAGHFEEMINGFFFPFNRWLENTEGCSKLIIVCMVVRI